jgi:hypothetical protein
MRRQPAPGRIERGCVGLKPGGFNAVVISNASAVAGANIGLPAEGSQLLKVNGKYYLFNIVLAARRHARGTVHRADQITGPYEGRVALQDKGVAQGSLIETLRANGTPICSGISARWGACPTLCP